MIQFNGYLHRERMAAIVSRWTMHRLEAGDARALKQIVNFNGYAGCRILDAFAHSLFSKMHGGAVRSFAAKTKGELKDFIIRQPSRVTPRIEEMIAHYRRYPEEHFRETPFNGRVYYYGDNAARYLGAARIKRFRRIAEKAGRYLIDRLFQEVKAKAVALADQRAARLGIPRMQLQTAAEEQVAEFIHAERRVLKAIRSGESIGTEPALRLNDILGVKVLAEGQELDRVFQLLDSDPDSSVIECENHRGNYNATNLIVRYRWPRDLVRKYPPTGRALEILRARGCSCDIKAAFDKFVADAEDDVLIEVIVSSYEDMLESEIGRAMHEERILAQRQNQQYQSPLARNVEYLMEFLFRFCLSPAEDLTEVPICLWGRYMPDYMDQIQQQLSGVSGEADFTHACMCNENNSTRNGDEYSSKDKAPPLPLPQISSRVRDILPGSPPGDMQVGGGLYSVSWRCKAKGK